MTTTTTTQTGTESRWWPTTWGRLAPGDEIQAPDGSPWTVGASLSSDGEGEWNISNPQRGSVWTPHREDEPVNARRPELVGGEAVDAEVMLGRLRAVFGNVEPMSPDAAERPGVGRWVACGARVCRCRR